MSYNDDIEPHNNLKKKKFQPYNLDNLSFEEMKEYILFLKNEICSTEMEIEKRVTLKGDANSLFKKIGN
jgi:uncharacterized small protein (DUF1192 family)